MTRILIVEDSPTQAEKLRIVLNEAGYDVTLAEDVPGAMAQFTAARFDLVISDIVMPGDSGYELCRSIKSSAKGKDTPVILLSTLGDPMDIICGLECGADNFVTKPYEPDHIVQRIVTVLENRRVRAKSKLTLGVDVMFLGRSFTVTSDKEQILDLLMATFEDIVRTNRGLQQSKTELAAAKAELETYAQSLERRVEERTAELREQKGRLDEAQAIAQIGSWRWALDTGAFEWSDEMFRIFGVDRKTFRPQRANLLEMIHPDDRSTAGTLFERALPQGAAIKCDARVVRKNGETRQCVWEGRRRDDGGTKILFGFCQDATDSRLVETQLHQAQKMEAVGQLTGGIAHDFNNLLTIVIGNLDTLPECTALPADVRERVDMALEASLRGAELTRQLLTFSRKQQLKIQNCNLNEVIEHAVALLGRTLGENIEIRCRLEAGLAAARTDPAQFESAIANLAINARDAMPNGGTITIESANTVLDENYAAQNPGAGAGEYAMVSVADNGAGMAYSVAERAFEPFFTTKDVGKGSGLGLSMVYGFVKQSGGHIEIDSEEGHGTAIRLYFPKAENAAGKAAGGARGARTLPQGDETILLVEDNPMVRNMAVRQLRDLGYSVLEAENAARALEILQQGRSIDLLFTDIVMPGGMNGAELAAKITKARPQLKILFTTGFADTSLQSGTHTETPAPVLSKPYRNNELARTVRAVLDG